MTTTTPQFRVHVAPLYAGNGVTYVVCLDRTDLDPEGDFRDERTRLEPCNRNDLAEANEEGQVWADFLGVPFTPCTETAPQDAKTSTVPQYGSTVYWSDDLPQFTMAETRFMLAVVAKPGVECPFGDELDTYDIRNRRTIWQLPEAHKLVVRTGELQWRPTRKLIELLFRGFIRSYLRSSVVPALTETVMASLDLPDLATLRATIDPNLPDHPV